MKAKRVDNLNVRINSIISYQSFLTTTFCVESLIGFDASFAQVHDWKKERRRRRSNN